MLIIGSMWCAPPSLRWGQLISRRPRDAIISPLGEKITSPARVYAMVALTRCDFALASWWFARPKIPCRLHMEGTISQHLRLPTTFSPKKKNADGKYLIAASWISRHYHYDIQHTDFDTMGTRLSQRIERASRSAGTDARVGLAANDEKQQYYLWCILQQPTVPVRYFSAQFIKLTFSAWAFDEAWYSSHLWQSLNFIEAITSKPLLPSAQKVRESWSWVFKLHLTTLCEFTFSLRCLLLHNVCFYLLHYRTSSLVLWMLIMFYRFTPIYDFQTFDLPAYASTSDVKNWFHVVINFVNA